MKYIIEEFEMMLWILYKLFFGAQNFERTYLFASFSRTDLNIKIAVMVRYLNAFIRHLSSDFALHRSD